MSGPALAPRPPDVSLDSSRAYSLGFDPPPLRLAIEQVLISLGYLGRLGQHEKEGQ
jgi:hypothetical protein